MGKIRFTINYQVKQKRKFEGFLHRYQTEIGLTLQKLTIRKYEETNTQFQASFFIETNSTNKEKSVFEILTMANKLWSTAYLNWRINGPHENGSIKFECILNNEDDDQPLKWAHIELESD